MKNNPQFDNGASPGKIFVGGLAKDATDATFNQHFGKYGEITDSVIMKDRFSGQPRGFGFITYADPSVVDEVIEDTHFINGKEVEIKRTIPKGASGGSKELKTKKIFVGGLPSTVTDDDFKDFFSKYGKVEEHQIILDHETKRSRGFGFIVFEGEEVVDDLLANGNRIDIAGTQVEIKKAEPKKSSNNPPPVPAQGRNFRARSFNDGLSGPYRGGFDDVFGPGPYRTSASIGRRYDENTAYLNRGNQFGSYDSFDRPGNLGVYRGEPLGFNSSRYDPYARGYTGMYNGSVVGGGYGPGGGGGYGNYGNYDVGSGSGGLYSGGRGGGYSNISGRYHPYAK